MLRNVYASMFYNSILMLLSYLSQIVNNFYKEIATEGPDGE